MKNPNEHQSSRRVNYLLEDNHWVVVEADLLVLGEDILAELEDTPAVRGDIPAVADQSWDTVVHEDLNKFHIHVHIKI